MASLTHAFFHENNRRRSLDPALRSPPRSISIADGFVTHPSPPPFLPSPSLFHSPRFFFFSRKWEELSRSRRRNLSSRESTIERRRWRCSARWKQEGHAVQRPLVARRIAFWRRASKRRFLFFPRARESPFVPASRARTPIKPKIFYRLARRYLGGRNREARNTILVSSFTTPQTRGHEQET